MIAFCKKLLCVKKLCKFIHKKIYEIFSNYNFIEKKGLFNGQKYVTTS